MTGEIVEKTNIVPMTQEATVLQSLQKAVESGADADSLTKILDMQERILNRQAEMEYTSAMVRTQKRMPIIQKNKVNEQTNSEYANLEAINKAITPIYTEEGFSLSFGTADSPLELHVRVTCDVLHIAGHTKKYHCDVPLDMTGLKGTLNKTKTHGTGSAYSYGQRYLVKLIFNLITGDEDDDGNAAGGDTRSAIEIQEYWINHTIVLRDIFYSIYELKTAIAAGNLSSAYETYHELSDEEKGHVWNPAPTKGGILTTAERTIIKSNEWSAARKEFFGEEAKDEELPDEDA